MMALFWRLEQLYSRWTHQEAYIVSLIPIFSGNPKATAITHPILESSPLQLQADILKKKKKKKKMLNLRL